MMPKRQSSGQKKKTLKKFFMNLNKKTSVVILFWGDRFTERVYSGKFHLVQPKKWAAL